MRYRQSLDVYDIKPEAMTAYLRYNGPHFNKKLYEWAVSQMKSREGKIEPFSKEKVEELLSSHSITLDNNTGYDACYVCMMAKADFYGSSITSEQQLAQFIKDYVDDIDQQDGFIFNRFYADCVHNGLPIEWEEVV